MQKARTVFGPVDHGKDEGYESHLSEDNEKSEVTSSASWLEVDSNDTLVDTAVDDSAMWERDLLALERQHVTVCMSVSVD